MKFKPLEFVTNTFVGPSSTELASRTHSEPTHHDDAASPRVRFESRPSSDSEAELDDSQFFQLRKDDHRTPRRHPQTTRTGQSPPNPSGNRKAVATTRNSPAASASANPRTTAAAKTPSPGRSMANQISPPSTGTSTTVTANSASVERDDASPPPRKDGNQEASTVDANCSSGNAEESIPDTSLHPAEKTPNTKQSNPPKSKTANEKSSNATKRTTRTTTATITTNTTTPTAGTSSHGSVTPTTTPASKPPKKRLSVYEQLTEDARAASEQWKEDAEAALRFKKQIYKEKLREIRDAEEDLKKRGEHLARLRQAAKDLQGLIQDDTEKKKAAVRFGSTLKRKAMRATQKALKDKEDAKANLKAKEAILKQALKEAKTKNHQREDEDHDAGGHTTRAKKRRKVAPRNQRNSKTTPSTKKSKSASSGDDWESSQDEEESSTCQENSSDSDADDSDWEGAPKRKAKTGKTAKDAHTDDDDNANTPGESSDPALGRSLRPTRVRSSTWTCSKCTLDNHLDDRECAACGAPRPGYIPDF